MGVKRALWRPTKGSNFCVKGLNLNPCLDPRLVFPIPPILQDVLHCWHWRIQGTLGARPLSPEIFFKSCSFQEIFRINPRLGVKTLLAPPLTKILDPPLVGIENVSNWIFVEFVPVSKQPSLNWAGFIWLAKLSSNFWKTIANQDLCKNKSPQSSAPALMWVWIAFFFSFSRKLHFTNHDVCFVLVRL